MAIPKWKHLSLLQQLSTMRMYKLVGFVFILLLFIPLLTHYYLTRVGAESEKGLVPDDLAISPFISHQLADVDKLEGQDLKYRIEELLRIKQSVSIELRDLEGKRQHLQQELTTLNRKVEDFKTEISRKRNELDRVQMSVQQAKVAEKEAMERNTPRLGRPKPLHPLRSIPTVHDTLSGSMSDCTMDSCFDYSLCPISSQFSFYLYPLNTFGTVHGPKTESLHFSLSLSPYVVRDNNPVRACLFLLLLEDCSSPSLERLESLPNWFGDGRNHVIWLQCGTNDESSQEFFLRGEEMVHFGRVMVIHQSVLGRVPFRTGFDLVVNNWVKSVPSGEIWSTLPPIVPAKRKYLSTYLGGETESSVQSELLKIQQSDPTSFVFQFSCSSGSVNQPKDIPQAPPPPGSDDVVVISEELLKSAKNFETYTNRKLSSICGNDLLRTRLLLDSTFTLILLPPDHLDLRSTFDLQLRLYEALKYGSVPVVFGTRFLLPFAEVIDWSKIVITFPVARISEIHYLLKSFTDSDILQFKKSGRFVFENYFGTLERVVQTMLGTFRTRIGLPPIPHRDVHLPSVFNNTFTPLKLDTFTIDPEDEENLGPIEPPYPSPTFIRNYSTTFLQKYDLWNTYFVPFNLYPFTPWEELMPSDAKFVGSSVGFRPIGGGAGGSGKEFSESLGGNLPKEQFTVVMLTYERELVLMNSIQRLYSLPYLNKVIVVWNSPGPPSVDLKWPDIGVPVQVVKAEKNSLNNRFLPFDSIETEAVLSIDDDAHLRHDEIIFGFRVWRENRDRIVGFPGRFHSHDLNYGGWLYNSNYSCELSMVLTGAAFYHKIYSYLYTYEMPEAIRNKVDELMNCEDIAMNFLVSHVTRKPPVKVTSRWTFRCPGCPVTLSEDDTHFQERHHCINFFTKVFGYTPLLNTQFRADSVLFKTRIPHDKQKCFKYI